VARDRRRGAAVTARIHASGAWRLRAEGLCVRRDGREVLRDVSLELASDETLSVIGPNGAGKTTLILALIGLLRCEARTLAWNENPVAALSARQRGRLAAYVPQSLERLPPFAVRDVVSAARFPHLSTFAPLSREDRRIVAEALTLTGVTELADRPVTQLSGGERQKVLLAAAIAQDAQLLVLDEPTTGLDPAYLSELVRVLGAWRARGRSVLIVSHDLNLARALGGRAIGLSAGRVVVDGPVADVTQPERLAEIFGAAFEFARTQGDRAVVVPVWGAL